MVTRCFFDARRVHGRFAALQVAINVRRRQMGLGPIAGGAGEPPTDLVRQLRAKGLRCTEIITVAGIYRESGRRQVTFWRRLAAEYPALHMKCREAAMVAG